MLNWEADYRTPASLAADQRVIRLCDEGKRVLGLGGGPSQRHPAIINLNIERFANVNVVGDAHHLPFAPQSFDGVHCEATFEHLEYPDKAAAELHRILKLDALGFICTPFMQPFHGYPSHFQNFTERGHRALFERAGFEILESGTCVGPAWALSGTVATFIAEYTPQPLRWPARATWAVLSRLLVRPLDRWLNAKDNAYVMASTTYVLIKRR
jgi:SAM-dependent methyltransferase